MPNSHGIILVAEISTVNQQVDQIYDLEKTEDEMETERSSRTTSTPHFKCGKMSNVVMARTSKWTLLSTYS